jgi:hypothetical protein
LKLATDARVLNALANHSDVLPYIGSKGEKVSFDQRFEPEWVTRTLFFHDDKETVGMLFDWTMPDIWELHFCALPEARGGDAVAFAIESLAEMLVNRGNSCVWGQVPLWNMRARKMVGKIGGVSRGFGIHPLSGEVEIFSARRDEWTPPPA